MLLHVRLSDVIQGLALTCGMHREFSRAKCVLGTIRDIQRSRVSELQNPEEDRPLAPHWRVPRVHVNAFKFPLNNGTYFWSLHHAGIF